MKQSKSTKIIAVGGISFQVLLFLTAYLNHLGSGEQRRFLFCCDWLETIGYGIVFVFMFGLAIAAAISAYHAQRIGTTLILIICSVACMFVSIIPLLFQHLCLFAVC